MDKDRLLGRLLGDLIEARERLKANSRTSSRPPSSDPPWSGVEREENGAEEPESKRPGKDDAPVAGAEVVPSEPKPAAKPKKKPGRPMGASGHSRMLTLPATATVLNVPPE